MRCAAKPVTKKPPAGIRSSSSSTSTPSINSLLGSRGPEAGVRGIPSPFINLDERGRDTPPPSLLPRLPSKEFLDGVLVGDRGERSGRVEVGGSAIHAVELHYRARSVGCKPRAAHGAEHLDDRGGAFVGLLIRHLAHGGCNGVLSRQGLHAP